MIVWCSARDQSMQVKKYEFIAKIYRNTRPDSEFQEFYDDGIFVFMFSKINDQFMLAIQPMPQ